VFSPGQHYTIEQKMGIMRCIPKTPDATSAYKTLQLVVARLVKQVAGAPPIEVSIDGTIGPSCVLAVQVVAGRLAEGKHQGLQQLATAQPEEAIPYVAQNAMEIAGYFDRATSEDPHALVAPRQLAEPPPPDPIETLKGLLTAPKIAAAGAALVGLTGIAILASASDKRAGGRMDRSHMLPESDGTDELEGEDDEHEDESEDEEPTPTPAPPAPKDESTHAA